MPHRNCINHEGYDGLSDACPACLRDAQDGRQVAFEAGAPTARAADDVNNPAHYTAGGIECIDAIEAALTPEEFRGFCKGNALKYVWRERHKGGDESLAKARWYINRMVKP